MTANAHGSLGLSFTVAVKGSCALKSTSIATIHGPTTTFFIGPVPVVITTMIVIYLDASADAQASVTSDVSVSVSANAGIGWRKNGGFYPINVFTPTFKYSPPSLSANATLQGNLTPTVDVSIYGVAGPQIALRAGLHLNADINANPWWTLTAPVDLTGSLDVPPLHLSSPTLSLYKHTFTLAHASGPFQGTG